MPQKDQDLSEKKRCMIFNGFYINGTKSAIQKNKLDSYEILIDNCCNHSLTNSKEDFIEPQVKSNNNAQSEGLQWTQRLNNSGNSEIEVKMIR
jgi:hypothetical protein